MKKEKLLVSKVGKGGFSLGKKEVDIAEVFEGYPDFQPPYGEEMDLEKDAILELENARSVLLFSDTHPPKIDTIYGRTINFCICFESREQKNEFLHEAGLYRFGDKYLAAEDFAEAFGIDLESGRKNLAEKKSGMAFGKSSMSFGSSLSFGSSSLSFEGTKKKKEVTEKMKQIRASEKELAKLMEWRADPEYWICLAFSSESHKTNLLKALGLELEFDGKYLWCHDVAKSLGVELLPCTYKNKDVYSGNESKLEAMIGDDL